MNSFLFAQTIRGTDSNIEYNQMYSGFINVINSDSTPFALEKYFELTNFDAIANELGFKDSVLSNQLIKNTNSLNQKIYPITKYLKNKINVRNKISIDSVRANSVSSKYGLQFVQDYLFCSNENGRFEILVKSIYRSTGNVVYDIKMTNIIQSKLTLSFCDCITLAYQNERADNIDAIYQIKSDRQIEDSLLYPICKRYSYWQTRRSFHKKTNDVKCDLSINPSSKNPKLIDSLFLLIPDLDHLIIKRNKSLLYPSTPYFKTNVSIGKYKKTENDQIRTDINLEREGVKPPIKHIKSVKFDSIIRIGSFDTETIIVLSLEIFNDSDNPLEIIDIIADCGCNVKIENRFKSIEPHEKKTIVIEIESDGEIGPFEKKIFLYTNSLTLESIVTIAGVFE